MFNFVRPNSHYRTDDVYDILEKNWSRNRDISGDKPSVEEMLNSLLKQNLLLLFDETGSRVTSFLSFEMDRAIPYLQTAHTCQVTNVVIDPDCEKKKQTERLYRGLRPRIPAQYQIVSETLIGDSVHNETLNKLGFIVIDKEKNKTTSSKVWVSQGDF